MIVEISAAALIYGLYKKIFPSKSMLIKNKFRKLFDEKKLQNKKGYYPIIKSVELTEYGAIITIDIKGICSFDDIDKYENYIKTLFGAITVELKYDNEFIKIQLVLNKLQDLKYQKIKLNEHQLLLGFDYKGEPIILDMKKTPHLLVSGLSGQGKTGMIKTIIKNLDMKITMLNGFIEDYKEIDNIFHINDEEKILKKLQDILSIKYYRPKPVYVVIEELSTIKNKKIIQAIKELLCIARHYNVYVIGVIQIATKEELTCKSYFNSRVSFRQIDSSSYGVALGVNIGDPLPKREFYLISDDLYHGKTYNLIE